MHELPGNVSGEGEEITSGFSDRCLVGNNKSVSAAVISIRQHGDEKEAPVKPIGPLMWEHRLTE